ncbi:MAG: 50S ribosomal protein L7/L12 [Patescibacteria group bacterium]
MTDEETKVEETTPEQTKAEVPAKFADLVGQIETLTVMDLAELVKVLEDKFGVSAAAPMAMMAPAAGGAAVEAAEEKSMYTIHLADAGAQKIAVIKVIRELRPDLGLKEAKDLVDAAPKEVKKDVPTADAEAAKKKLEEAGAKVELK